MAPEMSRGARGEAVLYAGDQEVRVLFTNKALIDFEKVSGKSVIGVAQGFMGGQAGVSEVAQLLLVGMQAARRDARTGGPAVKMADAIAVMDQVGFSDTAAAVMEAVAGVLGYSQDDAADDDGDDDPNA